jgi:hypothetical protein
MKPYRIILTQHGSKIVEAETAEEAIDDFGADVTGDALLQMLSIDAKEVQFAIDLEETKASRYLDQVVDIMYREPGGELNPHKEWSPDTLDALGSLLAPLINGHFIKESL